MTVGIAILAGALVAGAVYLMTSRNLIRYLFGLILLSNAANLVIFGSGGLVFGVPPLVDTGEYTVDGYAANALPQALILTAIVIGFGLLAFALALVHRAHEALGTVDTNAMRLAEPPPEAKTPEGTTPQAVPTADNSPAVQAAENSQAAQAADKSHAAQAADTSQAAQAADTSSKKDPA